MKPKARSLVAILALTAIVAALGYFWAAPAFKALRRQNNADFFRVMQGYALSDVEAELVAEHRGVNLYYSQPPFEGPMRSNWLLKWHNRDLLCVSADRGELSAVWIRGKDLAGKDTAVCVGYTRTTDIINNVTFVRFGQDGHETDFREDLDLDGRSDIMIVVAGVEQGTRIRFHSDWVSAAARGDHWIAYTENGPLPVVFRDGEWQPVADGTGLQGEVDP